MDATDTVPRAIFRNTDDVNAYLLDLDNYIFNEDVDYTIEDVLKDIQANDPDCLPIIIKYLSKYLFLFSNFENTLFEGDFSGINLEDFSFEGSKIINSNFSNAKLNNTSLVELYIENTKFLGAELQDAEFSRATIVNNTDFTSADLENAYFNFATIDETVIFNEVNLTNTSFNRVNNSNYETLRNNSFLRASYDGVNPEEVREIIEEKSISDPVFKGGKKSCKRIYKKTCKRSRKRRNVYKR